MYSARSTASMNPLHSGNADGVHRDHRKGVGRGAVPAKKCQSAATTKIARARYWIKSSTFWMRSPISRPRQLIQVMRAMKTTPVTVTSGTFSASSASSGLLTIASMGEIGRASCRERVEIAVGGGGRAKDARTQG